MKVGCEAVVEIPVETVWRALTDVDRVLAALPGAALVRDDDSVSGSLRCMLGSSQVTYRVVVRSDLGDAESHTAILAVTCKEARGSGALAASIGVAARPTDRGTTIEVGGEIEASGRGEAADAATWAKVLRTLLDAALRDAALPRPGDGAQTVDADPSTPRRRPDTQRQIALGVAGIVALLLVRRLRRRTRG